MPEKKRFLLSTVTSLYDPIEIEIDGKVYRSHKLSRPLLKEVDQYSEKAKAGDIDALYAQMEMLFCIDEKILDQFDIREIQDMLMFARSQMFGPKKKSAGLGKNASKLGTKRTISKNASK